MIEIPQPSIALNSHDVPGSKLEMWETWNVPASSEADWIVSLSSILAAGTSERVKCLVINSHGFYGHGTDSSGQPKNKLTGGFGLSLGRGITVHNAHEFAGLSGQIKCIVIIACATAFVTNKGADGDGELLCSKIAKACGAYVIAPRRLQRAPYNIPKNHIDNFEGQVVRFNPSGAIDGRSLAGRKLIHEVV